MTALTTACAGYRGYETTVDARVDGLASTTAASKRTYVLLPGNPAVPPLGLQFQEFKLQAERALHYRGFVPAPDPEAADLIIFLAYGLGTPQVSYDFVVAPSPPPPPATETQPSAQTILYTEPASPTPTPAPAAPNRASVAAAPASSTSSTPQGPYSALPHTWNIRYLRYVALSAIDLTYFKETGELAEVWRMNVTSIGKSDDLRRIVPVMLAAATRRIGIGTNARVEVRVSERHPKARYIRGEITEAELRRLESEPRR